MAIKDTKLNKLW